MGKTTATPPCVGRRRRKRHRVLSGGLSGSIIQPPPEPHSDSCAENNANDEENLSESGGVRPIAEERLDHSFECSADFACQHGAHDEECEYLLFAPFGFEKIRPFQAKTSGCTTEQTQEEADDAKDEVEHVDENSHESP